MRRVASPSALLLAIAAAPAVWAQGAAPAPQSPADPAVELAKIAGAASLFSGTIIGLLLMLGVTVTSAYLALATPLRTRRARDLIDDSPLRSLVVGSVNVLGLFLLMVVVGADGKGDGGAALVGMALCVILFLGAHAKAAHIGQRLVAGLDWPPSPLVEQALGMPVLLLHLLVPVVGWLAAAYFVLTGTGAVVLSTVRRRRATPDQAGQTGDPPPVLTAAGEDQRAEDA